MQQQDNQVKIIQAFSLVDLLKEVREATLEGYDFDFNTVENFPQQFGLHFHVPMVKGATEQSDSTHGAALQSTNPAEDSPAGRWPSGVGAVLHSDAQSSSENGTVQEERTEGSDEQEQEAPKRGRKKG